MTALTVSQKGVDGLSIDQIARETVDQWSALCQRFLNRQRAEILDVEPSAEKLEQHRAGLKWMLRFTRAIYLTASDPDYPDKRIANELHGRLVQLEHSWRMIHEKMPDSEAEQILREVFP